MSRSSGIPASQPWTLYVDGAATSGTSPAGGGYIDGPVELLGTGDSITGFWPGRQAAYKHWTALLTAAEVAAERWTYLPVRQAALWSAAPPLNVTAVQDLTGQAHDFTVVSAVASSKGPPLAWRTSAAGGGGGARRRTARGGRAAACHDAPCRLVRTEDRRCLIMFGKLA